MPRWIDLYAQLKNRRVIRTAVVYLALFWGAVEVADLLVGAGIIGENLVLWLLAGGALAFPLMLALSWFFEAPWRQRRWFSIIGDVTVMLVIGTASLLFVREQLFTSFTRPVVAVLRIEPTDTRVETAHLAFHLAGRFRNLLAISEEIRVTELESSYSELVDSLPVAQKAAALNADYLLGGTLNQGGGEVRLNMQLFDAEGELLWSERFSDRLLDQAQMQNGVLDRVWPFLPLSAQSREDIRSLVASCEYPAAPDAIRVIAAAGALPEEVEVEQLSALIKQDRNNGLLHLVRAKAYFKAVEKAPTPEKPVFQNMAMQDLEQAEAACPGHPEIDMQRLYHTRQLEAGADWQADLLAAFPNSSRVRLTLAQDSAVRGDRSAAAAMAQEAWMLNPLDSATLCAYLEILSRAGPGLAQERSSEVERVLQAVSLTPAGVCRKPVVETA